MAQHILVVDDDEPFVTILTEALQDAGYEASAVGSARDTLAVIPVHHPDLIVLDLGLPDDDGLVLISSIRKLTRTPIIVCSARQSQSDRVVSLKLGADDFVAKPFDLLDLEARIEAVLRRAPPVTVPVSVSELRAGDIVLMPVRGRYLVQGRPVHLTPIEARLLTILANHANEKVGYLSLYDQIWGDADFGGHTLDVHVSRTRQKLRLAGSCVQIDVVRKEGFMLVTPKED